MSNLGVKIASKRKASGMTQIEFAEKLSVTRQTVSRWEAGTVMPDIDKISDIATILGTSCDYLLKDDIDIEDVYAGTSGQTSSGEGAGSDLGAGAGAGAGAGLGAGTGAGLGSGAGASAGAGRLLESLIGKKVKLSFCEDEIDIDLYDIPVTIDRFEGNWMKVSAFTKKKETIEKLVPLASILAFEIMKEN